MKNKLYFLILTFIAQAAFAMGETTPSISIVSNEALYMGNCPEKAELETIYGDKFPLNTIFFWVDFKNIVLPKTFTQMLFGSYGYANKLPTCIPYQFIKDSTENSFLRLELYGITYPLLCKQKGAESYSTSNFETAVATTFHNFIRKPDYVVESKKSLIDAKIIRVVNGLCLHDKNCAPEARKKVTLNN